MDLGCNAICITDHPMNSLFTPIRASISFLVLFQAIYIYAKVDQEYVKPHRLFQRYDYSQRVAPVVPPKGEKMRVIIDTDAYNEIDDQWAIVLALLSQDRFKIEGFVAANYDNADTGGPGGIENSYNEILNILKLMDMEGRFPVKRGSHPMRYMYEASPSEGVDFIIETAMASTPEDPVWLISLGTATNAASAWLQAPEIADRVVFFWHGRTQWPDLMVNFNVFGDRNAAIILFDLPVRFVLFDTGGHLTCSMEETKREVYPYGKIGRYLYEYRTTKKWFQAEDKGLFDLGDVAALVDPDIAQWEAVKSPQVSRDLKYMFTEKRGEILRCYDMDRDATFQLLYDKLQAAYPNKE